MMKGKHKGQKPALYGYHAVREAWLNPARTIETLYMLDHAAKGFEKTLLEAKGKGLRRPPPVETDKRRLEKMLPPGAVHQGLALAAKPLDEVDVSDLAIRTKKQDQAVLVMLDQVTDPHNVGAILRSACAFGADGLILQRKNAPDIHGVLAKTACGAIEHVPVAYETNLSRALETLKDGGFWVIGLDERGPQTISDLGRGPDLPAKIVLVLGAEGPGMRRLVKENCDVLARLPTAGPIQALNVSNAAAVALFALAERG